MLPAKDMDRYEKRAREIVSVMNSRVRAGTLIAGTKEYADLEWMVRAFFKASKTYKPN